MNDETPRPTFRRATRAPWREIVSYRWTNRQDSALVLREAAGAYHLLWAGQGAQEGSVAGGFGTSLDALEGGPPAPSLRHTYDAAFHVDVAAHEDMRAIRIPHQYGPPEPVSLRVAWWVHDPVEVVRTQTAHGWSAVRRDLDERLRGLEKAYAAESQALNADELAHHLAAPRRLDHCGITYEVGDTSSREADDELLLSGSDAANFPYAWTATRREEYDFCVQAVRSGPVSLAALWLLRQPDQVRAVLDWVVGNRGLVREEVGWEEQMVGLLGCLSKEERQELSDLMRDRLVALGRRVPPEQPVPHRPQ